jgi:NAD(P)-dependent dehydrogenase (short-subunit alcohol dehydrogenase family)
MKPDTQFLAPWYKGCGKLSGKVALISGGDSGIGRSVAILYAREGADVAISYHSSDKDAEDTRKFVEDEGRKCVVLKGDVGDKHTCIQWVEQTVKELGRLDILVNNAAVQQFNDKFETIKEEQILHTFRTNIIGYMFLAQAALPHLKENSSIINTHSVVAYKGSEGLIDYAATKGAINTFTIALAQQLAKRGIRVNGVAPGPIWTPLQPATGWPPEKLEKLGQNTWLGRAGQPEEVAPAYVFLASRDGSYVTGSTIDINGGMAVGH